MPATSNDLDGKVAIVTGGTSGMGAATVALLARHGARVVSTDVNVELGRSVADAVGADFVEQDVSDRAGWIVLREQVAAACGRLDVMVNNAGIVTANPVDQLDLATWDLVIGINLTGVVLGCHHTIESHAGEPRRLVRVDHQHRVHDRHRGDPQ